MRLFSVCILKAGGAKPILLSGSYFLDQFSFFQRGSVREGCIFVAREVVKRGKGLVMVQHESFVCHARIRPDGLATAVVCDAEYPKIAAFSLIQQATEAFLQSPSGSGWQLATTDQSTSVEGVTTLLTKYQNPAEGDKVIKIQQELDEIKKICMKTIEDLLQRETTLEKLVQDSEDLTFVTKSFADKSAELNRCCTIL